MPKVFNVTGACRPDKHYMVDLTTRLAAIKKMVDDEEYFTINRARQFGKTTTLNALAEYLRSDYDVIALDFQTMSASSFESEQSFVTSFAGEMLEAVDEFPDGIEEHLLAFADGTVKILTLNSLFKVIKKWCGMLDRPPVLIIDEVDTATNNQVFLDFLAQLRACHEKKSTSHDITPESSCASHICRRSAAFDSVVDLSVPSTQASSSSDKSYYLKRPRVATFQSVILAGVYDVRNIKRKIRPDDEHKENSPWNIAAKFRVDMSFSAEEICGMLRQYEADYHTGMDTVDIAEQIYSYTSGYPVLVSSLCKIIDEELVGSDHFPDRTSAWKEAGIQEAVAVLLLEKNALFDSLTGKLNEYPELKDMVYRLLFEGVPIAYNPDDYVLNLLLMFGFGKVEQGRLQIANRIFEMRLYNYFLTLPEEQSQPAFRLGTLGRNQFIKNGQLDMDLILAKFVEYFDDIYGDANQKFVEDTGRRYFMLFLRPIINGTGNYYVEARTRNQERTDLIIDYLGKQYIIELKIWRGNSYNERGEGQLLEYLDHYHLKKGYMLSFCFNKKKLIGVREINFGERILVEAIV